MGQWWPPTTLRPDHVRRAATDLDVIHLHFGFEHLTPAAARDWVRAVRHARRGLVFTVHDLVNPHLNDQRAYTDLLDVLVPAADVLTTLTAGSAGEIRRRWGRDALVHPHPHVVDRAWLERPRSPRPVWTVGVHLKSLRANVDVAAVLRSMEVVSALPDAVVRIHVHREVLDPSHPRHDPRLRQILQAQGDRVDVRVHGPLTDADLWQDVLETDVALLPYLRGTHSGWLEMCHDLGTTVLAAEVGHLHEQRPAYGYRSPDDLGERLTELHTAHRDGVRAARPSAAARVAERHRVATAHLGLYRELTRRMCA